MITAAASEDIAGGSAFCIPRSRWLLPYVIAIVATGVATITLTVPGLPQHRWSVLLLFSLVAAGAEFWTVPAAAEGGVSLCFVITYTAAIVFGPCFAAITASAGALVYGVARHKGAMRTTFNMGQLAVTAGATGLAFAALRSTPHLSLTTDAVAYAGAAIAFIVLNSALASGAIALCGRPFIHQWLLALREAGIFYLAMAPLGALAASAYEQSPWTLLYFPLLVWIIYKGFSLFDHLRSDTGDALVTLADTIEQRDPHTFQHSVRVAAYVTHIARGLNLPGDETALIVSAARVHDLGKIAIDNRILFKEGPLTDEERRQVNTHPAAGAELAGKFSLYGEGADIIRHHHERWDGTGYPDGLAGDAIPLGARVIAVADVYDAMTSDRPYRLALSHEVAVSELIRGRGTQFDARVVEAFLAPDLKRAVVPTPTGEPARSCS
jgi:putative nucleotidyltransferase with HDIG domain